MFTKSKIKTKNASADEFLWELWTLSRLSSSCKEIFAEVQAKYLNLFTYAAILNTLQQSSWTHAFTVGFKLVRCDNTGKTDGFSNFTKCKWTEARDPVYVR